MKRKQKSESLEQLIRTGLFSKKEAGAMIAMGIRHVHSTLFGRRDACYLGTLASIQNGSRIEYPWERIAKANSLTLRTSEEKYSAIQEVVSELNAPKARQLREKITATLEELISNGLYHAYKAKSGKDKYDRKSIAELTSKEALLVRYLVLPEGAYLSVEDTGGSLTFDTLAESLRRCYGDSHQQIDSKPGGAGLGLFMTFEAVSHLCFERVVGKSTRVSVWIPAQAHFDPDYFSFNFFEAEK